MENCPNCLSLKAELEKVHLEASKGWYTPERDRERLMWKAKAEKLVKALQRISITFGCNNCKLCAIEAQTALAEYEKEAGK